MNEKLRSVLEQFSGPAGTLGGGAIDRKALRAALTGVTRNLRTMLWLAVGMTVVVFLVELWLLLTLLPDTKVLTGVCGAMGVTVAGSIETVRRLARDLAQTNLLVALASELDADALAPVINALARKI